MGPGESRESGIIAVMPQDKKELIPQVNRILRDVWDPIGVDGLPDDEYIDYARWIVNEYVEPRSFIQSAYWKDAPERFASLLNYLFWVEDVRIGGGHGVIDVGHAHRAYTTHLIINLLEQWDKAAELQRKIES